MFQMPLPPKYLKLSETETDAKIAEAKADLGPSTVILGHHYQRDEVIKFADYRGDSFKLSQLAAGRKEANYIVFCGVHFMAESADILSGPHQQVVLPDMSAGCSMADMADIDQVEECWETLNEVCQDKIVPITYMNSAANLKAFCGRWGGAVCTSSNAKAVIKWAFGQGDRLLFFPDQHLGRNTAVKMGYALDDMVVWDPYKDLGGNGLEKIKDSPIVLWKGHCSVHQRFTTDQVKRAREAHPDIRVIVHPECKYEVVQMADEDGSTEYIIKRVTESPPGSKWAVGTEIHLVHRLAKENPDKLVMSLDDCVCVCATMYRIDPSHLLWSLDNLREGRVVNRISVPPDVAEQARVALDRMLSIT
jgi:quinolinate synthase